MSNARELAELGGSYGTGGFVGMKNRIINGAMAIDQRNAGASVSVSTTSNTFSVDRWVSQNTQASKITIQQNAGAVSPPAGFSNYAGVTVGAAANVTVGAGDYFLYSQAIEANNMADLGWGGSSASPATLSFWVRSSLTGTFGGSVENGTDRSFPFSYVINSANTWEYKTIQITAPASGGTWGTGGSAGVWVRLSIGTGSTSSGTAGAWATSRYFSATGATNLIATNNATFYFTGVQLEKGSTATSFDYRPYGTELQLCQRYLPAFVGYGAIGAGVCYSAGLAGVTVKFPVEARVAPTGMTVVGPTLFQVRASNGAGIAATAVTSTVMGTFGAQIEASVASGLVQGNATQVQANNGSCNLYFTGCEL